ncbi:MAG: ATP-binding protein [Desulfitobacteriaceae bacterium]|nr:ATP-binding protein [Desulfitobacteriaceae bacterium]MDI6879991.1 ATP-binding protein [Desulfitobacteriaceae bacterium]MDI6914425.1 ATP-binding protein [Desulfitobacteriaceae bacterium]
MKEYGAATEPFKELSLRATSLTVYGNVRNDEVVSALQELLEAIGKTEFEVLYKCYHRFCSLAVTHNWPEYFARLILEDENPFSRRAAQRGREGLNPSLWALTIRDLEVCRALGAVSSGEIKAVATALFASEVGQSPLAPEYWPEWERAGGDEEDLSQKGKHFWHKDVYQKALHYAIGKGTAEERGAVLADYHHLLGYGVLGPYVAFRWRGEVEYLEGIAEPDPVQREQLIGLDRELALIAENTKYFLAGHAANNMILYGNRGTGKSSAVKSLLESYGEQGLRLVELAKGDLGDFPKVVRILSGRPQKFIIFVDDLSFDDTEPEYKALKTVLEGGLEAKPGNVLIYATSNRRHLIRENFSDRQGDEIHVLDTVEEKLSLADRFGITVTFPSPDQEGYLGIVQGLADQRGLTVAPDELRRLALRWEMMHNGRSGRTARQFIDYLEACLASPDCQQG